MASVARSADDRRPRGAGRGPRRCLLVRALPSSNAASFLLGFLTLRLRDGGPNQIGLDDRVHEPLLHAAADRNGPLLDSVVVSRTHWARPLRERACGSPPLRHGELARRSSLVRDSARGPAGRSNSLGPRGRWCGSGIHDLGMSMVCRLRDRSCRPRRRLRTSLVCVCRARRLGRGQPCRDTGRGEGEPSRARRRRGPCAKAETGRFLTPTVMTGARGCIGC